MEAQRYEALFIGNDSHAIYDHGRGEHLKRDGEIRKFSTGRIAALFADALSEKWEECWEVIDLARAAGASERQIAALERASERVLDGMVNGREGVWEEGSEVQMVDDEDRSEDMKNSRYQVRLCEYGEGQGKWGIWDLLEQGWDEGGWFASMENAEEFLESMSVPRYWVNKLGVVHDSGRGYLTRDEVVKLLNSYSERLPERWEVKYCRYGYGSTGPKISGKMDRLPYAISDREQGGYVMSGGRVMVFGSREHALRVVKQLNQMNESV